MALNNEITEMVHLKYLRIEGQQISHLPSKIDLLLELRTISLDNNKFTTLPDGLRSLPKLFSLTARKNQIE